MIITAAATSDATSSLGLILGVLALLGTVATAIAPVISKKVRSHSDIRDDRTVENTVLKEAAEAAMALVGEARENAAQAVEMVKGSLKIAQDQIASLNQTIDTQRQLISDLRTAGGTQAELIQRLEADVARAVSERNAAERKLDGQRRQLATLTNIDPEGIPA